MLYKNRLRTESDRNQVDQIYKTVFGGSVIDTPILFNMNNKTLRVGQAVLPRWEMRQNLEKPLELLQYNLASLQALMLTLDMGWMAMLVRSISVFFLI